MESREEEEGEQINVILKVTKTLRIKVKLSETIKTLKSILYEKEGISENLQELFFSDEQLKDDQKLIDYDIQTNSTLHLFVSSIKFFVNIPSYRKTLELEAKTHDTIQTVKSLIHAKEGIGSDCHSLFHGGKLLEDNKTLTSLKIQHESTIYLVFNPRDVLLVTVKLPSGEILKPEVKVLYTIGDIKAIIGSMVGFSVSDLSLVHEGKQLDDWKTLACYNISENSVLEILPYIFQIFVKDWNGKTVILDVHQEDTVIGVKYKILHKLKMPVEVQSLLFGGKTLDNDRNLASYNIQRDSTLHLVVWPMTLVHHMQYNEIGHLCPVSVRDLKAKIQTKFKQPVKELLVDGLALQDDIPLSEYVLSSNTTLVINLELRRQTSSNAPQDMTAMGLLVSEKGGEATIHKTRRSRRQ